MFTGTLLLRIDWENLVVSNVGGQRIHGSQTVCTTGHEEPHITILGLVNDTKLCANEDILVVEHYVPLPDICAMLKTVTCTSKPPTKTDTNENKSLMSKSTKGLAKG